MRPWFVLGDHSVFHGARVVLTTITQLYCLAQLFVVCVPAINLDTFSTKFRSSAVMVNELVNQSLIFTSLIIVRYAS